MICDRERRRDSLLFSLFKTTWKNHRRVWTKDLNKLQQECTTTNGCLPECACSVVSASVTSRARVSIDAVLDPGRQVVNFLHASATDCNASHQALFTCREPKWLKMHMQSPAWPCASTLRAQPYEEFPRGNLIRRVSYRAYSMLSHKSLGNSKRGWKEIQPSARPVINSIR